MKCVICRKNHSDFSYNLFLIEPPKSVTCAGCRRDNYPAFMHSSQYKRYWDAFHDKWRRENKDEVCHL